MSKELEDKDVEDKRQKRKVSMDKLFLGDPDRIHLATTKILFGSCFLGNYLVAIVMDTNGPLFMIKKTLQCSRNWSIVEGVKSLDYGS